MKLQEAAGKKKPEQEVRRPHPDNRNADPVQPQMAKGGGGRRDEERDVSEIM